MIEVVGAQERADARRVNQLAVQAERAERATAATGRPWGVMEAARSEAKKAADTYNEALEEYQREWR